MNNQMKWQIERTIKKILADSVQKGMKKEKISFRFDKSLLSVPECKAALDFLVKSEYLVEVDNGKYMISDGYYEYLKSQETEQKS